MNEDIQEYLLEPENLAVALELPELVEELKASIFTRFWTNVAKQIAEYLNIEGHIRDWEVNLADDVREKWSTLSIKPTGTQDNAITAGRGARVFFAFSDLYGRPEPTYYGIQRSSDNTPVNAEEQAQTARLKNQHFRETPWWTAYSYLHKHGLPTFDASNNATVMSVYHDNKNDDHPLAGAVVGLFIDLFQREHEAVRKIAWQEYG